MQLRLEPALAGALHPFQHLAKHSQSFRELTDLLISLRENALIQGESDAPDGRPPAIQRQSFSYLTQLRQGAAAKDMSSGKVM
jgi:hypothetical protein